MRGAFYPLHSCHSKRLQVFLIAGVETPWGALYSLCLGSSHYIHPLCLLYVPAGRNAMNLFENILKVFMGISCGFNRNPGFT